MAARPRKELDPKSKDFGVRFAIHLRGLLDKRKLGIGEFITLVENSGLDVSLATVKKWLSGDRVPRAEDFEFIGAALRIQDYRQAMPPPR